MTSNKRSNVIAVIVTYRPDISLLEQNIAAVLCQVDRLIVVDNSDGEFALLDLPEELGVTYHCNGENRGIAQALNIGLAFATAHSAEWLLTLDQDSILPEDYVSQLLKSYSNHSEFRIVSLAGAPTGMSDWRCDSGPTRYLITSGNLVKVSALNKIGGFRESFFIDYVDYDVSLRLRKQGFTLLACPEARFVHNLGQKRQSKLFGISFSSTNHNAMRRYYMTRNRLTIYKENLFFDPALVVADVIAMCKEVVKVLVAENDRQEKLKAILSGVRDALLQRTGKCTGTK